MAIDIAKLVKQKGRDHKVTIKQIVPIVVNGKEIKLEVKTTVKVAK